VCFLFYFESGSHDISTPYANLLLFYIYHQIVRGEKATQQRAPLLCLECKEEGNNSEECRFAMTLHAKRT
jgi:hypothetical protein